jgi:hypothetical protein
VNRWVALHAKSRHLHRSVLTLAALALGAPLLTRLLATQAGLGGFVVFNIYMLTALAGATLIGAGLAGANPELEATTARYGARMRLLYVLVAVVVVMAALVGGFWLLLPETVTQSPQWRQSVFLAESVAVLAGVQGLASTVLRARLSWVPGSLWVILLLGSDGPPHGWKAIAALPKGVAQDPFFAYSAGVALLIGTVAYAAKRVSR